MWRSFLLVTLVWAAIYLPRLGSLEIKSEEGRRILPAVTMLETGNYVVPQIGSEPYLRKPPLVNWLVAGSFKSFGVRNEWTARLPSVLCVLAVALAFVSIARRALGTKRFARRRHALADQFRSARKRPDDRDRSALCLAHCPCVHLLAELVERTGALARLDGAVDFPRARPAGQGTASSGLLLCGRRRRSLAGGRTEAAPERSAFCLESS